MKFNLVRSFVAGSLLLCFFQLCYFHAIHRTESIYSEYGLIHWRTLFFAMRGLLTPAREVALGCFVNGGHFTANEPPWVIACIPFHGECTDPPMIAQSSITTWRRSVRIWQWSIAPMTQSCCDVHISIQRQLASTHCWFALVTVLCW